MINGGVGRVVWDGDQLLAEQRTSGLDGITGGAPDFGTVRYVHLLGIDQPVAVLDNRFTGARVIHYNWRGLAEASSWADGAAADWELGGTNPTRIAWPAGQGVYLQRVNQTPPPEPTWIGSLPENGATGAGQLYRQTRYYDPASGRFTQEDPIGLAGGLNLYGFANGDPVNFSDPFGLCTWEKPQECKIFSLSLSFSRLGFEQRAQLGPVRGRLSASAGVTGSVSLTGGGFKKEVDAGVRVEASASAGPASVRCGLTGSAGCSAGVEASDGTGSAGIGTGTTPLAVGAQTTIAFVTVGGEVDLGGLGIVAARAVWDFVRSRFAGTITPEDRERRPEAVGTFR